MNVLCTCLLFAIPLLTAELPAQALLASDGSGRIVQLFDAQKVLAPAARQEPDPAAPHDAAALQDLADFLRQFIDPPLGPDDDLKALGNRWLVLLGSEAQVASASRLFAAALARREDLIDVQAHIVRMKPGDFGRLLKGRLTAVERGDQTTFETVAPRAEAKTLLAAVEKSNAEVLEAPRLLVMPLQTATIAITNQTAYVQDFTLTRKDDTLLADPIVATVWDGIEAKMHAAFLPDGTIGVACDVHVQELQKPIPTFTTTLAAGTVPVTIQLPRLTGTRLRQVAAVHDGDLVVLAAQKIDGDYIVAFVQASLRKH